MDTYMIWRVWITHQTNIDLMCHHLKMILVLEYIYKHGLRL